MNGLNHLVGDKLFNAADHATKTVANQWLQDPDYIQRGLYFRVGLLYKGKFKAIVPICEGWVGGDKNRDKEEVYRAYSAEKFLRTGHGFLEHGFISAKENLSPGLGYIGAIVVPFKIFCMPLDFKDSPVLLSCSGLPEEADEAAMIETAVLAGNNDNWSLDHAVLHQILSLSGNRVFQGSLEPGLKHLLDK